MSLIPFTTAGEDHQQLSVAPIVSSYNERIRPLLDAVDRLRHLNIMQEGIQLPTIVVVGDQSSGKSSVLESLAGISLPRGQGICTRVPLIMRLQNHPHPHPDLSLEFNGRVFHNDEENISDDISIATEVIAGKGKGISDTPLTLVVKKQGVPDLTMVDLPGITRVPVHGQPEDIYEQISEIITEFITPEESIILNVLSADTDFSTCESILMSQRADRTGQRTLAVVTKSDQSPVGLLEKVTANDVNIGLGYVCVRNRIGDETYDEARAHEANLFDTHPLLSKMDKSIVGIPVLAERLVRVQAKIIVGCLPDIIRKINEKLSSNLEELNKLPAQLTSMAEAMTAFLNILSSTKDSLKNLLIKGVFEEYLDDKEMHSTARLAEMLNQFSEELRLKKISYNSDHDGSEKFLMDEIRVLEDSRSIGLPNFLPKEAFITLLQRKVNGMSMKPVEFVEKIYHYIEKVVISVLLKHSEGHPQLVPCMRRAAQSLISEKKEKSVAHVNDLVAMEKCSDYTCNPEYMVCWNKLMLRQEEFIKKVDNCAKKHYIDLDEFGLLPVNHLDGMIKGVVQEAFDVKMRMTAYWDIVTRRMVDNVALHLMLSIHNLVDKEVTTEIVNEFMGSQGNGLERMLQESPSIAGKRVKLQKSVKLLNESKDVVSKIVANID